MILFNNIALGKQIFNFVKQDGSSSRLYIMVDGSLSREIWHRDHFGRLKMEAVCCILFMGIIVNLDSFSLEGWLLFGFPSIFLLK